MFTIKHFAKEVVSKLLIGQAVSKRRFILQWNSTSNRLNLHPEVEDLWKLWCNGRELQNGGDFSRFFTYILNITHLLENNVEGSFAELGVYKGNSAAVLNYYAKNSGRTLYLYDTFDGFDERDLVGVDCQKKRDFCDTSIEYVKSRVGEAEYRQGFFPDSTEEKDRKDKYAFVSLDCDLYEPTKAGLEFFYPRLNRGGVIICHDYSSGKWKGVTEAVDEFCSQQGIYGVLLPDREGSVIIAKD